MRGLLAICPLLSVAACDAVFSLDREPSPVDANDGDAPDASASDLDSDGIADDLDPCIAIAAEGGTDSDNDGLDNNVDTCPFDGANGGDTDSDGVGNICDPFPTAATDRSRCIMLFSSPTLNNALWRPRPPDLAWTSEPLKLIGDPPSTGMTATTIVSKSIEGVGTTTYDIAFAIDTHSNLGSVTLWLRADPIAPSSSDIGCRFIDSGTTSRYGVQHGSTLLDPQTTQSLPVAQGLGRLFGRVVTTGGIGASVNVTCTMSIMGVKSTASASVPLPDGRFGIAVDRWRLAVNGLQVLDHP